MKPHPRPDRRPPAASVAPHALGLAVALFAAAIAGCDKPPEITTYETPRVQPRVVPVDPAEVRGLLDHMFAAIVPSKGEGAGKVAWFFKLVANGPAADEVRKPFEDFIATVNVDELVDVDADQTPDRPAWTLPDGWTEQPGGPLRAATIVIPRGEEKLEITVSKLPLTDPWAAYLKENVGRWMGQLQQSPLSDATIKKLARTVPTSQGDATVFELVGTMKRDPMGVGGAAMPAGHPPLTGRTPLNPGADTAAAPTSPPAADSPAAAAGSTAFTYDAPADWQPGPLSVMGFKREASFKIDDPDGKAELAVTRFPAQREMAALGPNVRRWAGQVGIVDLTDEDIKKASQPVKVDGADALLFEFVSPGDVAAAPQGIRAVMAVRGDEVWFVKLSGDKAAVENQRDAFDAFLKSIRFTAE